MMPGRMAPPDRDIEGARPMLWQPT